MTSRTTRLFTVINSDAYDNRIGRAFSVDDGLMAVRWAEIMRPQGYRLTFSHDFIEAEEGIQVYQEPEKQALATIFLGVHWVWVVHRAGQTMPYADTAAALNSIAGLSKSEQQSLFASQAPEWLWRFQPTKPTARQLVERALTTLLSFWRRNRTGAR